MPPYAGRPASPCLSEPATLLPAVSDLHVKSNLSKRINVIWVVQPFTQKYSDFQKSQISL
jgi:hypothetical protein